VAEDDTLGGSGWSRSVHDAEGVFGIGLLVERSRVLFTDRTELIEPEELSISSLEDGADLGEEGLKTGKEA
jgi:hypothetical protein